MLGVTLGGRFVSTLTPVSADLAVFLFVVALRLGIPLLILRYPLPAIVASLVIDAADQTIFQQFTDLNLDSYQSYDKSLDVYYLAIAFIATMRNWRHPVAVTVAFGLWYYRLVGVTLFELTEWRPLLLIFPNTFEYFFIAIACVRIGWDSARLSARNVITTAAAIWIVIKLPQEYWIHVAQRDVTDTLKEGFLGVDPSSSWGDAFANRPLVAAAMFAVVALAVVAAVVIWRRLPERDYPVTFASDKARTSMSPEPSLSGPPRWHDGLVEKIVLVGLIFVIFSKSIPNAAPSVIEILVGVAVLVAAHAAVHAFVVGRSGEWRSVGTAFLGSLAINTGIWALAAWLLPSDDDGSSRIATAFFLFLITLIVSLFDRYRPRRPALTLTLDDQPGTRQRID